MALTLSKGRKKNLVKLPVAFFDRYLPKVNGDYLKIYLFGLKLCLEHQSMTDSQIAKELGVLQADVKHAWRYWEKEGLITVSEDGSVEFENPEEMAVSVSPPNETTSYEALRFTDVFSTMKKNAPFQQILQVVEASYPELLTQDDVLLLYDITVTRGIPLELLMITLAHCLKIRKKNMKYIYKVVTENYQDGLTTPEELEQHFTRTEESSKYLKKTVRILKLTNRELSDGEKEYIRKWEQAGKTDAELKQAYEKMILSIGKLSFPYLDKILMNENGNKPTKKSSVKVGPFNNFEQPTPDFKKITDEIIQKQLED